MVGSVENVRTILVHVDAFNAFAIHIATQMRAFVYNKAIFAFLFGKIGESGSIEA